MNREKIEITDNGFLLNGKPFNLMSGDIHYFRIHPSGWKRRLELMKDFGLNTVETYVPWNRHEPVEGQFDFTGMYDLAAFLKLCDSMELKVLLRPSPYICSETDLGGVPAWLLKDRTMTIRASDRRWLDAVRRYYKKLCKVFVPYLSTNGGPIILVAVENEYGVFGNDKKYLVTLKRMLEENGVDVPFFTTDPTVRSGIVNGSIDGCLAGANFRSLPGEAKKAAEKLSKYHPGFPFFVGELWGGRQIHWGETYKKRDPVPTAQCYREALELGYVNFYMFCGGTNWGFYNGAVIEKPADAPADVPLRYTVQATSYDEDSPVSENGEPTEKYFLLRDVLDEFLGKPLRPHVSPTYRTQEITVDLTESARLFENLDAVSMSKTTESAPRYMEDLGQDFGYILYRVKFDRIEGIPQITLRSDGVKDYAAIYQNGKYIDYWLRDRKKPETVVKADTDEIKIDVLVENLGRINCGVNLADNRKGLDGYLAVDLAELHEIETVTLPMKDLSKLNYRKINGDIIAKDPVFLRGYFDAEEGVDTFLSLEGLCHGFAVINGFNIGRYLPCGPQKTLYIPGGLLKSENNTIEIFDLSPRSLRINMVGKAQLEMEINDFDVVMEN